MLKPDFTEEEIEQLYRLFMEHRFGVAKKKLHVVYLKALGLPHQEIVRIARVSGDSVTRYLKAYAKGGVAALCTSQYYCFASALLPHRDSLKIHFHAHLPHTIAQASHAIEKLIGINLALSACRDFMRKHLGMKCRKMAGQSPLKQTRTSRKYFYTVR